ncbi:MAG: RuvX/YqgF family protein [Patescibacteria group bacterium]
MKILGVDYGLKHIGLAIGDSELKIAMPAGELDNDKNDSVIKEIIDFVNANGAQEIVIGRPLSLENKVTEQTELTDEFIEKLKKSFPRKKIHIFDERLTSQLAERLDASGDHIHASAAAVILDDFFSRS